MRVGDKFFCGALRSLPVTLLLLLLMTMMVTQLMMMKEVQMLIMSLRICISTLFQSLSSPLLAFIFSSGFPVLLLSLLSPLLPLSSFSFSVFFSQSCVSRFLSDYPFFCQVPQCLLSVLIIFYTILLSLSASSFIIFSRLLFPFSVTSHTNSSISSAYILHLHFLFFLRILFSSFRRRS